MLKSFTFLLSLLGFLAFSSQALATDPIYTSTFSNKAVGGYDTVSYFTKDAPVKGSKEFKTEWKGAEWLFSSQENLEKFKATPEQYAPQYGGYCAWAVAHDNFVKGDPEVWNITDGKLYLNYNKKIAESWKPRREELIPVADKKYQSEIK